MPTSFKIRLVVSILVSALLAGCAAATAEPTPTPAPTEAPLPVLPVLPTAVPPETLPGTWAIAFRHTFEAGFWSAGSHRYGYFIECPALEAANTAGEWRTFRVTSEAPTFQSPIYLRLGGLSTGQLAPINMDTINPDQSTVAVVTILGVTEEVATQLAGGEACEVVIGWDDGFGAETLLPGQPFQP